MINVPSTPDHDEVDLGPAAGVTDRGLRHHRNEDAMALGAEQTPDGLVVVAVVCDGVSSSPRPDEASHAAAQAALQVLLEAVRTGGDLAEASRAAVVAGRESVAGLGEPANERSATTFLSAVAARGDVTLCWLGDSRAYYESVQAGSGHEAAAVPFPGYYAERRFRLTGGQMQIGRRSVSRGVNPEIDLTGPPADPGISRLHAVLIATPDGNWAVLDPGSANGTLVNGSEIPTDVQVPLQDGDRINLGGWTAITVHRG